MLKENMLKLINQSEVKPNGKSFTVSYIPTISKSETVSTGISSSYSKMGRKEVAYTVYLANQLINFTSKGHTVYLYVKTQSIAESFLYNAIELSGRKDLINLVLLDCPSLVLKRINYGETITTRFLKYDLLNLSEISKGRANYQTEDLLDSAMKKSDIIWSINGLSTKKHIVRDLIQLSKVKTVLSFNMDVLNKTLAENKTAGDYSFISQLSTLKI